VHQLRLFAASSFIWSWYRLSIFTGYCSRKNLVGASKRHDMGDKQRTYFGMAAHRRSEM
jgi:hypothetical protein